MATKREKRSPKGVEGEVQVEPLELSSQTPRKGKAKGIKEEEVTSGDIGQKPQLPVGPTMRGRITPFVFQIYPPFRIAVKNVEEDRLIEGMVYDMILAPILFDPESDLTRKIAIYPNDAQNSVNRGFYRAASTKAELFKGLQILEPTMAGANGRPVPDPNANLQRWLAGLKAMWDVRQQVYEHALRQKEEAIK